MLKNIFIFILVGFSVLKSTESDSINTKIEFCSNKFKYILENIYINYADSVELEKISEIAYQAMLKSLDNHSFYLNKDQLYNKNVSDNGANVSIGLELIKLNDSIYVYSVQDSSPASYSGIKTFDKIISINGINVNELTAEQILNQLKGKENSVIDLVVSKAFSHEVKSYQLQRKTIPVSSINTTIVLPGENLAYINFNKFSKMSHFEFLNELNKVKDLKGLIIDLRDNPGGFLDQVGQIINEFIKGKELITYTNSRNKQYHININSNDSGKFKDIPLVILVNEQSASACELFAATIQDLDRGLIVGRRTFGKSSAQMLWKMNDSTGFQMTVAEYYSSLGRKITKNKSTNLELDESLKLNLNDQAMKQLTQIIDNYGTESKLPIFTTKKGRNIIGGGAIMPDILMDTDQPTLLTNVLLQKNILIEYVYSYLLFNYKILKNDYGNSLTKYSQDFFVTDLMLSELKRHANNKNIWNEEMFQTDLLKIKNLIKAEIARAIFGDIGYYSILVKNDKYVAKAIELMPEANYLINQ